MVTLPSRNPRRISSALVYAAYVIAVTFWKIASSSNYSEYEKLNLLREKLQLKLYMFNSRRDKITFQISDKSLTLLRKYYLCLACFGGGGIL